MELTPAGRPFAELADMRQRLEHHAQSDSVDGERLAVLLESSLALEDVYRWAAEMQLGAEGFDNMTLARLYNEVQGRLLVAAREIAEACQTLETLTA